MDEVAAGCAGLACDVVACGNWRGAAAGIGCDCGNGCCICTGCAGCAFMGCVVGTVGIAGLEGVALYALSTVSSSSPLCFCGCVGRLGAWNAGRICGFLRLLRLVHMVPDGTQLGGVVIVFVAHGCSLLASIGRIDDWLSILDCSSRLPYRLAIGVISEPLTHGLLFPSMVERATDEAVGASLCPDPDWSGLESGLGSGVGSL